MKLPAALILESALPACEFGTELVPQAQGAWGVKYAVGQANAA